MIAIITTCARPEQSYLRDLIESINTAGWSGQCFLVCDGFTPEASPWPVIASRERVGQKRTYWRALELGVEWARRLDDDHILILEDDVELCRNAVRYMTRLAFPPLDFVSWFDGHAVPAGAPPAIYSVAAESFLCLQAVSWRRRTAETLLAAPQAASWTAPHRGDELIAQILAGRRYGVHVPNLVQHLGAVSVCNPGAKLVGLRTSRNYPGRDFDALRVARSW